MSACCAAAAAAAGTGGGLHAAAAAVDVSQPQVDQPSVHVLATVRFAPGGVCFKLLLLGLM
jgi:hypothetical protein